MSIPEPKSLTIVIPAFNEERFIVETIRSVLDADSSQLRKEVIVINDGSRDNTANKVMSYLARLAKAEERTVAHSNSTHILMLSRDTIILVDKEENAGKGAAVKTGFLRSTGDLVLVQDADLEYDPVDYPRLLDPILKGYADVVFGTRFASDRSHRVLYFWHFVGNTLLTLISNMCTDLNLSDMETGYKVFRGSIIRGIAPTLESTSFGFEPEITAKVARNKETRIYEVGISYRGRTYQEGKKLLWWKDGMIAIWRILYFRFVR